MNTEEYAWAVQNLANNQHFLNNELDLEQKNRQMMADQRDQHLVDKEAKEARWPNMYGDQNPLPPVALDMNAHADPRQIK